MTLEYHESVRLGEDPAWGASITPVSDWCQTGVRPVSDTSLTHLGDVSDSSPTRLRQSPTRVGHRGHVF